jgi:beta-glucosidase
MMGVAFVQAFERAGVVATPKHFVANVGDGGRDSYPIDVSERALVERFFPPFEAAVRKAVARSVMTAYNSVDGTPATQNRHLLTDVLKGEWGFGGFVISDAAATGGATVLHMTEPDTPAAAAHAWRSGLDVVFQTSHPQHAPYLDAVRRGLVPIDVVDAAVTRVLTVKFNLGLFEHPYVDPEEARTVNGHADHLALAREAARASIVLLKNDHDLLPLPATVRAVAVIGVDAEEARLGGYSGPGIAKVSMLEGLRQAVGPAKTVRYAPGPGRVARQFVTVPARNLASDADGKPVSGLRGEYFDNDALEGSPRFVRTDPRVDFGWTLNSPGPGIPFDWYSVRWTGRLTAPPEGVRTLGVEGNDGYRLYLDGALLIDNWKKQSFGSRVVPVTLRPDTTHDVRLEFFESTGNARVKLVWDGGAPSERDRDQLIAAAIKLARQSDVAIVVAGLEEGEFRDRAFLRLPGRQEDLILAVAATGTPVVVVIVGGSAITMLRWIDRVGAIVDAWYPGEQGGHAVADVLFGSANPAGRLPITFPMGEGQLPLFYNHKPTGRGDDYLDLTGQPLFPFGFGLSYTTFSYSGLRIEPAVIGPGGTATVRCTIRNTGARVGDEVVQFYLRDELASAARPVTELAGFTRVRLEPGQSVDVAFEVGPDRLRMLDERMRWVVEPGAFRVMVGASSKDIRLRGQLMVR